MPVGVVYRCVLIAVEVDDILCLVIKLDFQQRTMAEPRDVSRCRPEGVKLIFRSWVSGAQDHLLFISSAHRSGCQASPRTRCVT